MRIRKNAKTSPFLHTTNSTLPSNNHQQPSQSLCLLNQSPWDIISFPSTHSHSPSPSTSIHLFDDFLTHYHVTVAANRSLPDSVTPINQSVDCDYDIVKVNVNGKGNGNGNGNGNVVDDNIRNYESYQKEDKLGFMCEDTDTRVDIQNGAVWATNKKAQAVSKSRGAKKRAVAITPKQNEFYYYSGFGPSWGRKRGALGDKCTTFNACGTVVVASNSVSESSGDDMDVEEDEKRVGPDTTTTTTVWSCQVGPETGYVKEDEEDNEKQKEKTVKKRGRKPIKARSLKSLM